ncbi:MAG: 3-deoxy-manno-octulosonate cytidylyltransferase [Planctomycetes bacterium]|jgi:3-deoxy-manno-octulosonate cytidylyltransferase (CMP-KDO synthetase)|nr:3-deoxy-manno-octulosonate cytidylyltransferase [Planctomycetota bacterium]
MSAAPTGQVQALAIIPVRVGSQRLPGKALLRESGQELFLHTCDQASKARNIDRVVVATDDDVVEAASKRRGYQVVRTSPACRTGSERCAEAAAAIPCRAVLDIQGDWPEVEPRDLEAIVDQLLRGEAVTNTLCVPLSDPEVITNPNVVKVVRGGNGKALYFSRAPIPYVKEGPFGLLRHIGVYGFARDTLLRIPALPSSGLAEAESLEQLRFLENDIPMHVLVAQGDPWGIETRSDYDAFLRRLHP